MFFMDLMDTVDSDMDFTMGLDTMVMDITVLDKVDLATILFDTLVWDATGLDTGVLDILDLLVLDIAPHTMDDWMNGTNEVQQQEISLLF